MRAKVKDDKKRHLRGGVIALNLCPRMESDLVEVVVVVCLGGIFKSRVAVAILMNDNGAGNIMIRFAKLGKERYCG